MPAKNLMETMEKYGFDVGNIRGQGFDVCAAISGIYRVV